LCIDVNKYLHILLDVISLWAYNAFSQVVILEPMLYTVEENGG